MCPRKLMGVVLLLALFTVPMRAIASGTIRLTVPEAVSLALKQSPRIKAANFELDAAEAARKKARARFGPVFQVEARAMYFNEPPSLGGGGMSAEDVGGLQQLAGADPFDNAMIQFFQELPSMFQSEQYDINITARVVPTLIPFFRDHRDEVQLEALSALAKKADEASRESVLELLVNEETPLRLRASTAGTLKNLGWSVRGYRKRVEEILPDGMHVDRSGRIKG